MHIDKASEKKRNISTFKKFCALYIYIYLYTLYIYIYIYIYIFISNKFSSIFKIYIIYV